MFSRSLPRFIFLVQIRTLNKFYFLIWMLRSTFFYFDGSYYEQTDGTAMSSPISPVAAI